MARAARAVAILALGLAAAQGCAEESTESDPATGVPTGTAAGTGGAATGAGGTGGAATGVGPTGGTGGASTGTGTGSGTSTGTGPGASCLALSACCDELGSAMYSACVSVVQMGQEATCDSILTNYHQNGYCTDSTACADLATCCPELPPGTGWKDTCDQYVEINNAPQCEYLLGVYQQDGYCN